MGYFHDSGFTAFGQAKPQRGKPENWLVWHFTHVRNLDAIASSGCLRCPNRQQPVVSVALDHIKERRQRVVVAPDESYPRGKSVADHVPFYIAPKSPMLYVVTRGHEQYPGGDADIVFLGLSIGRIAASGVTWCVSDANAAVSSVRFSREVGALGDHVDFDLLCQRDWSKTPDDPHRPSRRAAELLILDEVPLSAIQLVVAKVAPTLESARMSLGGIDGVPQYHLRSDLYYN